MRAFGQRTRSWVWAVLLILAPGLGLAEGYSCAFSANGRDLQVTFVIDRTQFSPAYIAGEPPRRALADVDLGGRKLVAEALLLEAYLGFHSNAPGDVEVLLTMDASGKAQLSQGGLAWLGHCWANP